MNEPIKILWVEEETDNALAEKRAYIETLWEYNVVIADTFKEGAKKLKDVESYNVVIIDIRIPIGFDEDGSVKELIYPKYQNRSGLDLILELHRLQNSLNKLMIYSNESWLDIKDVIEPLDKKGEDRFLQKKDCRSNRDFESFILKIYERSLKDAG